MTSWGEPEWLNLIVTIFVINLVHGYSSDILLYCQEWWEYTKNSGFKKRSCPKINIFFL